MKKLFSLVLVIFLLMIFNMGSSFSAVNKQMNANIKTKRVPAGTVIKLRLLDPINSTVMELGDGFDLVVTDNVKVDNLVVIPQGTLVRGSVEEIQKPAILYKGGMVRLYFDHIVSPTGKHVSFTAGIFNNPAVTYDGALSSKTNYGTAIVNTAKTSKNIIVKPTVWAWEKGDDMLNGTPKYFLGPLAAIVSTPVAGIYFIGDSIADIFKKGKDVNFNQGETIYVQLIKPVDMPVY